MNLEEATIKELEKLEEMASIKKSDYNTPVGLWVDEIGNNRNVPHYTARLKLVNNYTEDFSDLIPISIDKNPQILAGECKLKKKDLEIMKKFIIKNYDIFKARWDNKISTRDMFKLLDQNN